LLESKSEITNRVVYGGLVGQWSAPIAPSTTPQPPTLRGVSMDIGVIGAGLGISVAPAWIGKAA
jgi:hypothetical protein